MRTKAEHNVRDVIENIKFRHIQITALLNSINYNYDMIIQAEASLADLYEEAQIASIVGLCLTGK